MKGGLENTIFSTLAYHRSPWPHKFRHVYRDLTSQQLSLLEYLPCCFTLIHTPVGDERQHINTSWFLYIVLELAARLGTRQSRAEAEEVVTPPPTGHPSRGPRTA